MLIISHVDVTVANKKVLRDFSFELTPGSIHAIMGPNGSGKSSLAHALAGHPSYGIVAGTIALNGNDLLAMTPAERCRSGLFMAFQNPITIPGLSVYNLLKESCQAVTKKMVEPTAFIAHVKELLKQVGLDESFIYRKVHEGFSGGEKKRLEILQMLLLKPSCVILDEIDSGLDVDALKIIAHAIRAAHAENPQMSIVIITHYQRILHYIQPDRVHILCDGRLAASGDSTMVQQVETRGYDEFRHAV
jgi:Fe-S cluster assembly ATP-binding protein